MSIKHLAQTAHNEKTEEVDTGREGTDQDRNELLMYDKGLQADPETIENSAEEEEQLAAVTDTDDDHEAPQ